MQSLTPEGRTLVEQVAQRHNVSTDAVMALLRALDRGGGMQAQFSHPDLGGMGQWSRGGMIMVGDIFNNGLKARVDQLCNELSDALGQQTLFTPEARGMTSWGGSFWPQDWGSPSSSGSQNDMSYACFPDTRRLAIKSGGVVRVYDTGDHRIGGVSQQQSGGQDLSFSSQYGTVRLHELLLLINDGALGSHEAQQTNVTSQAATSYYEAPHYPSAYADTQNQQGPTLAPSSHSSHQTSVPSVEDDVFSKIERLHELQRKGILSEAEFTEKKKELLARI